MLRVQVWDAENGEGVDVELDPSPLAVVEEEGREELAVPASLTERARLRSLHLAGMEKIEEWLEGLRIGGSVPASSSANGNDTADANMNGTAKKEDASPATDARPDVEADSVNGASNGDRNASPGQESALDRLGLEQAFERLFELTLGEMGSSDFGTCPSWGSCCVAKQCSKYQRLLAGASGYDATR